MSWLDQIGWDPQVAPWLIAALGALLVAAALLAGASRLRSAALRLLAAGAVVLALLNPQRVEEEREPLPDTLVVIRDGSESTTVGTRGDRLGALDAELAQAVADDPTLEAVAYELQSSSLPGQDGTRLLPTLSEALGEVPPSRLAGVVVLTDGQIHDAPDDPAGLLPDGTPLHVVVPEAGTERDRRMNVTVAPTYGLVDEEAEFTFRIEEPGGSGTAVVELRINGELQARQPVQVNEDASFSAPIDRRGRNTVELRVADLPGELTTRNNVFVSEISGIRDRLRVLLLTGSPHSGGRAWRNLLKSDPAVDLVHFTILTNPTAQRTNAPASELSLIEFPTRQLFEESLDEFDLIIFDQYTRRRQSARGRTRALIRPNQLQNIARYVEGGGALLVAAGPGFAGPDSLYRTPLAAVLPAIPTGEIAEDGFRPRINAEGRLHPITRPIASGSEDWGRWFRIVDTNVVAGNVLMEGPQAEPLLVIDRVGDGRVAVLASDQAWLWAKGYEGGGPYSALFRNVAHWLMGEPDLSAERLTARSDGGTLLVERTTLETDPAPVTVTGPDGTQTRVELTREAEGIYRASVPASGPGAYRLDSGETSDIAAIGALNPREFSDLATTLDPLTPFAELTGGLIAQTDALPAIRRVRAGADTSGGNWMGLVANGEYEVRDSRRADLLPPWAYLVFAGLCLGLAWRREGT